jgi:hypothetical protein
MVFFGFLTPPKFARRCQSVLSMQRNHNKEEDNDVEYGHRQSWRSTTYKHCGSSSIAPAQIMEREICYKMADLDENYMIYIYHLIFSCQAAILCLQQMVGGQWSDTAALVASLTNVNIKRIRHELVSPSRAVDNGTR